jgi:hypothetical protein
MTGRITLWDPAEGGPRLWTPNTTLRTGGYAIARALGLGDRDYRINMMYIEFENVADPGDAVSAPTYTERSGRAYYEGLGGDQDYLRVALFGLPLISVKAGDEDLFADGEGNVVTYRSMTAGTAGVNGVEFSNAANSKVHGVALVAAPDLADRTKDVLVARGYYSAGNQKVKPVSGHLMVGWEQTYEPNNS